MEPDDGNLRRAKLTEHLALLEEAVKWLGIQIGRAPQYVTLMKDFYESDKREPEHLFAYNESCEITDIYLSWRARIGEFAGLKEKITKALSAGPVLRERERVEAGSNEPRNLAFAYSLAGTLLDAGLNVIVVDGITRTGFQAKTSSDIAFLWKNQQVEVECKRPRKISSVKTNIKKARKKLTTWDKRKTLGVIGLDCSAFIRPDLHFLESQTAKAGHVLISQKMEEIVVRRMDGAWNNRILAALAFARVPAMTVSKSNVLDSKGETISYFRRDSICSYLLLNNLTSQDPAIMASVFLLLKRYVSGDHGHLGSKRLV